MPAIGASRWTWTSAPFEHIVLFARGDAQEKRTRRRLRNFYREEETTVCVYQRLVLILKMRPNNRLPRSVDTRSVYLKVFKDIPKQDVNMLLPGAGSPDEGGPRPHRRAARHRLVHDVFPPHRPNLAGSWNGAMMWSMWSWAAPVAIRG